MPTPIVRWIRRSEILALLALPLFPVSLAQSAEPAEGSFVNARLNIPAIFIIWAVKAEDLALSNGYLLNGRHSLVGPGTSGGIHDNTGDAWVAFALPKGE